MQRVRQMLGISVFWIALSMLWDGVTNLVLPDHLVAFTSEANRATVLGLVSSVGLLAGMLIQPLAGMFSDRMRHRWGRRGSIALGALAILGSLALFSMTRSVLAVLLGFVVLQMALSAAQAAQQGLIPDLVPRVQRGTAAGLKGLMDLAGSMLGFMLLGWMLSKGTLASALLVGTGVVVLTLLLTIVMVREPKRDGLEQAGPLRLTLADAFRLDWKSHRAFVWLVIARFLFLLGTFGVGRFLLLFVAYRLGINPARAEDETAALFSVLLLITALASPLAGWLADRLGRVPVMMVGALLSMAGTFLLILAASPWQMVLFGGLMALGSAGFASANWAMTADLAPPGEGARFFALANFGTAGAAAAAGLFGLLVDGANATSPGLGYVSLLIAAGLSMALSALALRGLAEAHGEPDALRQPG